MGVRGSDTLHQLWYKFNICYSLIDNLKVATWDGSSYIPTWWGHITPRYLTERYFWVFLDEIIIWISRLSQTDGLPQCRWASSNLLRTWKNKKEARRIYSLTSCFWAGTSVFSYTQTGTSTLSCPGLGLQT